ncbi:MAG TPA: NAD-dependent epimerase/dehydratase family protein [Cycloclasticus sp.]|nr:NAD-dependent epimerase/dehydratase family protein [Cycloclasticus sp.]HIL91413.1 NAD-dependent epimerase/dehydratase family protein [Cycloclasticus sp.]
MAKILIIGCGDIGGALAEVLVQEGHEVTGLKRTLPSHQSAVRFIKADITKADELASLPVDFDQVIYIISPSSGGTPAYEDVFKLGVDNVLARFEKKKAKVSFTFVSSTRVYGQHQGEWLNEESETKPIDERGKILLAAENKFLDFNSQTTIIRFSGIYGRSNYFLNQLKGGVEIQKEPPYYTNRIHKEDCVGALAFLINKKNTVVKLKSTYLVSDCDPASKWDVACYLADGLSIQRPPALMLDQHADCNKRLDNRRLIKEGYQFKYKTYMQGFKAALNE